MTHPSFRNRRVGSLNVEELKHLGANWMAKVRATPGILLTGHDLTLYRALEEAFIYHGLESPPSISKRQEDAPALKREPSASPQQGLKLPMSMTPVGASETLRTSSPLPQAPLGIRPARREPTASEAPFAETSTVVEQSGGQSLQDEGTSQEPEISSPQAQSLELIRAPDSDGVLDRLDEANAALDRANTLEEVKDIADVAAAEHLYAKRAKRGKEAENKAAAYFCRASAKLGRMLAEGRETKRIQKRGRPEKRVQKVPFSEPRAEEPMTLAKLGLDKRAAAQARKLAKYTPDDFEARLKGKLELSRTSTLEDPKPKENKPVTRKDCIRALSKLVKLLAECDDNSFDAAFPRNPKFGSGQVPRSANETH
jgi:hypothetical protein